VQYEAARGELQSPPKRIPLSGIVIEALVLGLVTTALLWFI